MAVQRQSSEPTVVEDSTTPTVPVCAKCGLVHTRCSAHARKNDNAPCTRWAMKGQTVCMSHGGKASRAKAKAVERVAVAEIVEATQVFGIPRRVDPATGLIEEYWRSAGIVERLEALVSAIKADDLTFGVVEVTETEGARDWPTDRQDGSDQTTIHLGGVSIDLPSKSLVPSERKTVKRAGVAVVVKLFNEERDRFAKLGEIITRLGLEAQRDAFVRDQANAFTELMSRLDLTKDQRRQAVQIMREMASRAENA